MPQAFPVPATPECLRHFGEHSTLVVIEAILAVVGDVEIFPSVVVVVADANALAPAGRGQSGFGGDVGKRSVVIVAIQMIGGRVVRRESLRAWCRSPEKYRASRRCRSRKWRRPVPVVSMMYFLVSFPPKTVVMVRPAFSATVGEVGNGRSFCGFGGSSRDDEDDDEKRSQSASARKCTRLLRKTVLMTQPEY